MKGGKRQGRRRPHTIVFMKHESQGSAAELLREARQRAGLSQGVLAARAEVPRTMVSTYERGLRQPTLPTLRRLLCAAGFDLAVHLVQISGEASVLGEMEAKLSAEEHEIWERLIRDDGESGAQPRRRPVRAIEQPRHRQQGG